MTKYKTRRKSERQFVWEYLRRNRLCVIEELLVLSNMGEESLRGFFGQLERAGYVKQRQDIKTRTAHRAFASRVYTLVKNTGILCPVWVEKQKRLFDRNEMAMQAKDPYVELPVTVNAEGLIRPVDPLEYAKGRIRQISKNSEDEITQEELMARSGLSQNAFEAAYTAIQEEAKHVQVDQKAAV